MKLTKLFTAVAATALMSTTAIAGDVTLTVKNIKNDTGHVVVRVFHESQAADFPIGTPFREEKFKAVAGEYTHQLQALPKGTFAIGVFHDLDDNGELNKNFLGAPAEPVGNTGEKVFLIPKFDKSSFVITDENMDVVAEF
jgi:uncharacterized protein (DUF2141 family)